MSYSRSRAQLKDGVIHILQVSMGVRMDLIRESARNGFVIFHEEVARDGAQGKTLLLGPQRIAIAKRQSALFQGNGHRQLVFNAGFPSIGPEEQNVIRELIASVDSCYLGVSGRATFEEADLLIKSISGARFGRISIALPTSEQMCFTMLRKTPQQCLQHALEITKYILDADTNSVLDFALVDVPRAALDFVADAALQLTDAGASMIIICDTVGSLYPAESRRMFDALQKGTSGAVSFVAHMHNDLGFGLVNTLEALNAGVRGLTSSWLGLGERAGMPATEQLLFSLGHELEDLASRLDVSSAIWPGTIDLRAIVPLARYVSQTTGRPLLVTDPIVGSGVNSISTGTPFVNPGLYQPFDPEVTLGVSRKVLLTPLASKRVVAAVAKRLGWTLNSSELSEALIWIKAEAYERGVGIIEEDDFIHFCEERRFTNSLIKEPMIHSSQIERV